jgi:hypothetical protein
MRKENRVCVCLLIIIFRVLRTLHVKEHSKNGCFKNECHIYEATYRLQSRKEKGNDKCIYIYIYIYICMVIKRKKRKGERERESESEYLINYIM